MSAERRRSGRISIHIRFEEALPTRPSLVHEVVTSISLAEQTPVSSSFSKE